MVKGEKGWKLLIKKGEKVPMKERDDVLKESGTTKRRKVKDDEFLEL